jgi:hypothetical protein
MSKDGARRALSLCRSSVHAGRVRHAGAGGVRHGAPHPCRLLPNHSRCPVAGHLLLLLLLWVLSPLSLGGPFVPQLLPRSPPSAAAPAPRGAPTSPQATHRVTHRGGEGFWGGEGCVRKGGPFPALRRRERDDAHTCTLRAREPAAAPGGPSPLACRTDRLSVRRPRPGRVCPQRRSCRFTRIWDGRCGGRRGAFRGRVCAGRQNGRVR